MGYNSSSETRTSLFKRLMQYWHRSRNYELWERRYQSLQTLLEYQGDQLLYLTKTTNAQTSRQHLILEHFKTLESLLSQIKAQAKAAEDSTGLLALATADQFTQIKHAVEVLSKATLELHRDLRGEKESQASVLDMIRRQGSGSFEHLEDISSELREASKKLGDLFDTSLTMATALSSFFSKVGIPTTPSAPTAFEPGPSPVRAKFPGEDLDSTSASQTSTSTSEDKPLPW